jgi:hypothetical protein
MPARPSLLGTYATPRVTTGAVVTCLYSRRAVAVVGWSDAPIPWPLLPPRSPHGDPSLWVEEVLARAIRTESASALGYWFGVDKLVVSAWRKAFGVGGPATTPGSKLAHRLGLGREEGSPRRPRSNDWSAEDVALLGTAIDRVVATQVGRMTSAVRGKRRALKIPAFGRRAGRGTVRREWTTWERVQLGRDADAAVAEKLGRATAEVTAERERLGIPEYRSGG